MSMSSVNLDSTISRFPEERQSLKRLEALLNSVKAESEYTFEHLYQKIRPSSPEVLALVLSDLAARGVLQKIVRVESPVGKGGIADFSSITEVPDEIHDWRSDRSLRILPE